MRPTGGPHDDVPDPDAASCRCPTPNLLGALASEQQKAGTMLIWMWFKRRKAKKAAQRQAGESTGPKPQEPVAG